MLTEKQDRTRRTQAINTFVVFIGTRGWSTKSTPSPEFLYKLGQKNGSIFRTIQNFFSGSVSKWTLVSVAKHQLLRVCGGRPGIVAVKVLTWARSFKRPIVNAGTSFALRLPRLRQTPARSPEVVVAAASDKNLVPEIPEVCPTSPSLVGSVEVVSTPEAESRQPVWPSTQPVLLLGVFVDGHRQISVTRGSEPLPAPAVDSAVFERVRRVEPVPASCGTRSASPPSFAQPVEVRVAVLVVASPSRNKLSGWSRKSLSATEQVVVMIVSVMTRNFSTKYCPVTGSLLPVEGVMKVTVVVVVAVAVQQVLEMVLGILTLKRWNRKRKEDLFALKRPNWGVTSFSDFFVRIHFCRKTFRVSQMFFCVTADFCGEKVFVVSAFFASANFRKRKSWIWSVLLLDCFCNRCCLISVVSGEILIKTTKGECWDIFFSFWNTKVFLMVQILSFSWLSDWEEWKRVLREVNDMLKLFVCEHLIMSTRLRL